MRQEVLAAWTGYTRRTILSALHDLEYKHKLIRSVGRQYPDGRNAPKEYYLQMDADFPKVDLGRRTKRTEEFPGEEYSPPNNSRVNEFHPDRAQGFHPDRVKGFHNKNRKHRTESIEQKTNVNSNENEIPAELTRAAEPPSVSNLEAFGEDWNKLCGNLPNIRLPLSEDRRKRVQRLIKKHGPEARELFRAAVQSVAQNSWWVKGRYGFDNLVPGKVERYAERWQHSGNLTDADVKLVSRAQRIAAALGDDK